MNDLQRHLQNVANARRTELLPTVYHHTQGQVQTGPFQGMTIVPQYMWGDGDTAAKLMGVYEDELHASIESAITANPDIIVNIGCAEGYYAIGAKLRTNAETVAVDLEQRALDICMANASANKTNLEKYTTSMTAQELQTRIQDRECPWLILDCEGYEEELLDIAVCPALTKSMILVETHDVFRPGLTDRIREKFGSSHDITLITQQTKDPYQFDWTGPLSDCDKWALVHEGRPITSTWLWMTPR